MLHLSEFVWILRSSVLVVFNNFLLIDATDRSEIRSDQKRLFFAVSLYPFNFSRTLPLRVMEKLHHIMFSKIKNTQEILYLENLEYKVKGIQFFWFYIYIYCKSLTMYPLPFTTTYTCTTIDLFQEHQKS